MPLRPKPKSRYASISSYVKYLKQFPKANNIKIGRFYVYFYMFDKSQDFSIIKFYDLMPFSFIYDFYKTKDGRKFIRGLNFHHANMLSRFIWLSRVRNLVNEDFENNNRLIRLAKWNRLFLLMKKLSKKTVRQYNIENIREIREIPNNMVEETLRFYARTHYGISINKVESEYLVYRI